MKSAKLVVALCVQFTPFLLLAQNKPDPAARACGDPNVKLAVHLAGSNQTVQQVEPGKARIYFIQEEGWAKTQIGIDGKWVGANKKNSYFSVSVEPGEHHLCMSAWRSESVELLHLTAEVGKTYYYRERIGNSFCIGDCFGPAYLSLEPVDSDEAKHLIESYSMAIVPVRR